MSSFVCRIARLQDGEPANDAQGPLLSAATHADPSGQSERGLPVPERLRAVGR